MGFFKKDIKEEKSSVVKESGKAVASKKEETTKKVSGNTDKQNFTTLISPWVTEKTHGMIENDKYAFKVDTNANKRQIMRALKEVYGVTAESINVINIKAKKRYFGRKAGMKSGYKKAIVTLKKGDKIELFQGV